MDIRSLTLTDNVLSMIIVHEDKYCRFIARNFSQINYSKLTIGSSLHDVDHFDVKYESHDDLESYDEFNCDICIDMPGCKLQLHFDEGFNEARRSTSNNVIEIMALEDGRIVQVFDHLRRELSVEQNKFLDNTRCEELKLCDKSRESLEKLKLKTAREVINYVNRHKEDPLKGYEGLRFQLEDIFLAQDITFCNNRM